MKIIIITLSVLSGVSLIASLFFKVFDWISAIGILMHLVPFGINFLILSNWKSEAKEEQDRKKTFEYVWIKVNEQLNKFPDSDKLQWSGGKNPETDTQHFWNGNKQCLYRSIYAKLGKSSRKVLIIYDVENGDIAKYNPNPTADLLNNPWHKFKPFENISQGAFRPTQSQGRGLNLKITQDNEIDYNDYANASMPDRKLNEFDSND